MSQVNGGNLKKGMFIEFKNEPWEITRTEFVSPGKGSAFTRCKLKSVKNGNTIEFTFKSVEMLEELDVTAKEMQFLYADGEDAVFMDQRTYDQVTVPGKLLEGKMVYMLPETTMYLVFLDEDVIGVRFPQKVKLKVTHSESAVAGNTVNAPKKPVTVETGIEVMAPLFVKVGDVLVIDTETGEYVSRAN